MARPTPGFLLSSRGSRMRMSYTLTYEAEDVVASLLGLQVRARSVPVDGVRRRAWLAANLHRLGRTPRASSGPGLVLAIGQSPQALMDQLPALPTVDSAGQKVAIIDELWRDQLPLNSPTLRFLSRFDHVFLGASGTCDALAELIDRPVHFLPHAVDACRFVSVGRPARKIDVYAMGRLNPAYHEQLLDWSREEGHLYLYDTFRSNPFVRSYAEHRDSLAGLIARARVFIVNRAKVGEQRRIDQSEVGYRYFEGAMGGAVLLGHQPQTPAFDELFPWPEAVLPVAPDASNLVQVVTALLEDADRCDLISRRNQAESLRRHDVAHRVRSLLATIGAEEPAAVDVRIESLAARADAVHPTVRRSSRPRLDGRDS